MRERLIILTITLGNDKYTDSRYDVTFHYTAGDLENVNERSGEIFKDRNHLPRHVEMSEV